MNAAEIKLTKFTYSLGVGWGRARVPEKGLGALKQADNMPFMLKLSVIIKSIPV
jgi:hypothetical protein